MSPFLVAIPKSVMKPMIEATERTPPARNTPATPLNRRRVGRLLHRDDRGKGAASLLVALSAAAADGDAAAAPAARLVACGGEVGVYRDGIRISPYPGLPLFAADLVRVDQSSVRPGRRPSFSLPFEPGEICPAVAAD